MAKKTGKQVLLKKQEGVLVKIKKLDNFLVGSLVILHQTCGRKGCHCEKAEKHPGYYFSVNNKGKTKMCYVPKNQVSAFKKYSENHKKLKELLLKLTLINMELLKYRKEK